MASIFEFSYLFKKCTHDITPPIFSWYYISLQITLHIPLQIQYIPPNIFPLVSIFS